MSKSVELQSPGCVELISPSAIDDAVAKSRCRARYRSSRTMSARQCVEIVLVDPLGRREHGKFVDQRARSRVLVVHPDGDDAAISSLVFEIYDIPQMPGASGLARRPPVSRRASRTTSARRFVEILLDIVSRRSSPTTSARQFIDNELDIVSRRSSRTTSAQRLIDNVLNIVSRRPSRTTSARQFVDNVPDAVSRRAARTTRRIEEAPYPP